MITLLLALSILGASLTFILLVGEFFVERNGESKFAQWWRNHVVGVSEENDF